AAHAGDAEGEIGRVAEARLADADRGAEGFQRVVELARHALDLAEVVPAEGFAGAVGAVELPVERDRFPVQSDSAGLVTCPPRRAPRVEGDIGEARSEWRTRDGGAGLFQDHCGLVEGAEAFT